MLNNIYRHYDDNRYVNGDNIPRILDKKSCLNGYWNLPEILVGKPRTIEYKDSWGFTHNMDLISMATKVTIEDLKEIAPQFLKEVVVDTCYSAYSDAVIVSKAIYFRDFLLDKKNITVNDHPEYQKLKEEYKRKYHVRIEYPKHQTEVVIDGKSFKIDYGYLGSSISIDTQTLYSTDIKNIRLDDGSLLIFFYRVPETLENVRSNNLKDLKNKAENIRIAKSWKNERNRLEKINKYDLNTAISLLPNLGRTQITISDGGFGNPIYGFICLSLNGNTFQLDVLEDETEAESHTQETAEFLYDREIKANYSEKKFRFKKEGKGLSRKEQKVKEEFDSEVHQLRVGLNIYNLEERLSYLEELFQVYVEELKKVF